jgi:hypothetical protein
MWVSFRLFPRCAWQVLYFRCAASVAPEKWICGRGCPCFLTQVLNHRAVTAEHREMWLT